MDKATSRLRVGAWIVGVAVLWGFVTEFIGLGAWTNYVVAYGLKLPGAVLFGGLREPLVIVGVGATTFLLLFLCVGLLRAPPLTWAGVPIGQVAIVAAVWVWSWPRLESSMRAEAIGTFLKSDVVMAILCAAAAVGGAYAGRAWRARSAAGGGQQSGR